jgi:purine-binding chemotaxis protein CheW
MEKTPMSPKKTNPKGEETIATGSPEPSDGGPQATATAPEAEFVKKPTPSNKSKSIRSETGSQEVKEMEETKAKTDPGRPHQQGGPVLSFDVAGQRYGLPVANVIQIVEMVAISTLPEAPAFVSGVIDFRGKVIPMIDMRRRFQRTPLAYGLNTPIVISQLNGYQVGLVVDTVNDVINLRSELFEHAEQIISKEMIRKTRYLAGVARLEDGLLLMLDPPTLLSPEEARAIDLAQLDLVEE